MRARGRIRVGYVDGAMPYSYFNGRGELVGFDVEMAYTLAGSWGWKLSSVPVPRERLAEVINAGLCDVIMAGISVTTGRASEMVFSPPYIDETLSFVVPDHRRADFSSAEWVRTTPACGLLFPTCPISKEIIHREFPRAEIVPVSVDRVVDFFTGRMERIDALVFPAERGSYFTLLYPAFSVAVPHPLTIRFPSPIRSRGETWSWRASSVFGSTCSARTARSRHSMTIGSWGGTRQPKQPRWSVIRNVLHWVK